MDKETKRRAKITIMGILGLVLLIIGISFAAFSANLAGVQVQTMNTGCLKVDMTDEGSVNTDNAMPETDESGLSGEPYTYKITNSCTTDAYYTTTINVMNASKLENADKIKVALDGDSYLAPTIESNLPASELLDDTITGVLKTYKLDEGYLKVGETKTFELRTWIDYDVESISGSLENKIIINSVADNDGAITYNKNTAGYYVLSNNTKLSSADYTKISPSTEEPSGIIEVKDNSGTTYHFRGNPNNYLLFGTYNEDGTVSYTNSSGTTSSLTYKTGDKIKWRILGTNNDGSINIIKDDLIGENTIDSSATIMSNFYTKHLQDEENYINTSQQFCNETKDANNNYLAKIRVEKHNPTSECNSTNQVTKIGLPTVDDVMYAGGVNNTANTSFYLYKDIKGFLTSSYASDTNIYQSSKTKSIGEIAKTTALDIRPVITLKSDTKLEGSGTEENPFYVSGKYGQEESNTTKDSIAPIIDKVSVDAKWSNKNKNIDIAARDNSTGSGLAGYIVKTENKTPTLTETGWEASTSSKYTTVNSYDNGTYYVFAKDNAGNISEGRKIVIEKVDKEAPTCTIRINPNGTAAPYKTLSIISNDTNIDLDGYSWDHTNYTEDVVKVTDNGSYTGHLTDLAGNKGSCTGVVTNIPDPNSPELDSGMIPVYYDETSETWKKADENNENNNWYNYNDKKWANSVTVTNDTRSKYKSASIGTEIPMDDILTMQVWIPRYKYKVWNYNADGTKTSNEQEIEISFEDGTASTGEITCTDSISGTDGNLSETCKLKSTNATCTDDTCNNKTYTHPAFTFGNEEIKGFWIGKFELTGTISSITTKPNLSSLREQSISSFETNIMKMKSSGNQYGLNTTTDTHMMKNMEWGAVAYLSHSKYGTCTDGTCKEVTINNSSSYYTGRSGGNSSASGSTEGTYKYNETKQTTTTITGGGTAITPTVTNDTTYPWTSSDGLYKSSNQGTRSTTTNIKFSFTAPTNNTYLSFDWSVSSNNVSSDYLYYTITKDGTALSDTGTSTKIGGTDLGTTESELIYNNVSKKLDKGTYELTFTYRKGRYSSGAGGTGPRETDTGYIKNIKILDNPTVKETKTPIGESRDGPSASTTHNIYGVYDMSGGAYEYTMANIVSNDGTTMIPSSSGFTTHPDAKYYDKYSYSTSFSSRIRSKLGDGIKEVYKGSSAGWYDDNSDLAGSNYPWFVRGGYYYYGTFAGAFCSGIDNGNANSYSSSRLIITP